MVDGMRSESSVYDLDVPAQVVVAGRSVALTDTEQDVPVVGDRKLEADHLLVELAGSGIVGYRYQYAGAFGQLRIKRCLILFVKTIEEEGSDIESPEIAVDQRASGVEILKVEVFAVPSGLQVKA